MKSDIQQVVKEELLRLGIEESPRNNVKISNQLSSKLFSFANSNFSLSKTDRSKNESGATYFKSPSTKKGTRVRSASASPFSRKGKLERKSCKKKESYAQNEDTTRLKIFGQELETLDLSPASLHDGTMVFVPEFVIGLNGIIRQNVTTQGIFRKAGSSQRQNLIKKQLNAGEPLSGSVHPIDAACILKQFLRSIPNCLLSNHVHSLMIRCLNLPESEQKEALTLCSLLLSKQKQDFLAYLLELLSCVSLESKINCMDAYNLSVVIAPNVFHSSEDFNLVSRKQGDVSSAIKNQELNFTISVIQRLIENADGMCRLSSRLIHALKQRQNNCSIESMDCDQLITNNKKRGINRFVSGFRKMVQGTSQEPSRPTTRSGKPHTPPKPYLTTAGASSISMNPRGGAKSVDKKVKTKRKSFETHPNKENKTSEKQSKETTEVGPLKKKPRIEAKTSASKFYFDALSQRKSDHATDVLKSNSVNRKYSLRERSDMAQVYSPIMRHHSTKMWDNSTKIVGKPAEVLGVTQKKIHKCAKSDTEIGRLTKGTKSSVGSPKIDSEGRRSPVKRAHSENKSRNFRVKRNFSGKRSPNFRVKSRNSEAKSPKMKVKRNSSGEKIIRKNSRSSDNKRTAKEKEHFSLNPPVIRISNVDAEDNFLSAKTSQVDSKDDTKLKVNFTQFQNLNPDCNFSSVAVDENISAEIRLLEKQYDTIKTAVESVEQRVDEDNLKDLEKKFSGPLKTESTLSCSQLVNAAYEKMKLETQEMGVTSGTENLTRRLDRELKIRSRKSDEFKVLRSPSERKIGSIRRRSREMELKIQALNSEQPVHNFSRNGSTNPPVPPKPFSIISDGFEHKLFVSSPGAVSKQGPLIKPSLLDTPQSGIKLKKTIKRLSGPGKNSPRLLINSKISFPSPKAVYGSKFSDHNGPLTRNRSTLYLNVSNNSKNDYSFNSGPIEDIDPKTCESSIVDPSFTRGCTFLLESSGQNLSKSSFDWSSNSSFLNASHQRSNQDKMSDRRASILALQEKKTVKSQIEFFSRKSDECAKARRSYISPRVNLPARKGRKVRSIGYSPSLNTFHITSSYDKVTHSDKKVEHFEQTADICVGTKKIENENIRQSDNDNFGRKAGRQDEATHYIRKGSTASLPIKNTPVRTIKNSSAAKGTRKEKTQSICSSPILEKRSTDNFVTPHITRSKTSSSPFTLSRRNTIMSPSPHTVDIRRVSSPHTVDSRRVSSPHTVDIRRVSIRKQGFFSTENPCTDSRELRNGRSAYSTRRATLKKLPVDSPDCSHPKSAKVKRHHTDCSDNLSNPIFRTPKSEFSTTPKIRKSQTPKKEYFSTTPKLHQPQTPRILQTTSVKSSRKLKSNLPSTFTPLPSKNKQLTLTPTVTKTRIEAPSLKLEWVKPPSRMTLDLAKVKVVKKNSV